MATATHLSYKNRARFRRFVTGVLVGLLAATGVAGAPAFADSSHIQGVSWTWVTPNTGDTIDGSRLIMASDSNTTSVARLEFDLYRPDGDQDDYLPGDIRIEIPFKVWTDRNGNLTGTGEVANSTALPKATGMGAAWVYEIDSARGVLIVENGRVAGKRVHGLIDFRFKVGGALRNYVTGTISDEYKATISTPIIGSYVTNGLDAQIFTSGSTTCSGGNGPTYSVSENVAWDGVFQIDERTLGVNIRGVENGNQNSLWKSPITIASTDTLTQGVVLSSVRVTNWDASEYTVSIAPDGRSATITWDGVKDAPPDVNLQTHYPTSLFEGVNPNLGQTATIGRHLWDVTFTSYQVDTGPDADKSMTCRDQTTVQRARGTKPVIQDKDDTRISGVEAASSKGRADFKGPDGTTFSADQLDEGKDLTASIGLGNKGAFDIGRGFLPVLSVGASTAGTVNAGERVEYTATLTNPATDRATRPATVEIPIPDGFSVETSGLAFSLGGNTLSTVAYTFENGILSVPVTNIEPGEEYIATIPLVAQTDGVKATVGVLNAKQLKHEMGQKEYAGAMRPTRTDTFVVTNTGNGATPAGVPFEIDRVGGGYASDEVFKIADALVEYHAYVNGNEVDVPQSTSEPAGYTRNISLPALKEGDVFTYTITVTGYKNNVGIDTLRYVSDIPTWNNADYDDGGESRYRHVLEYRTKLGTLSPLNNPYTPQAHDAVYAVCSDRNKDTVSNSWSLYADNLIVEETDLLQYISKRNRRPYGLEYLPFDSAYEEFLTEEDLNITGLTFGVQTLTLAGEGAQIPQYVPLTIWGKKTSDATWTRYAYLEFPNGAYATGGVYGCPNPRGMGSNTVLDSGVTLTSPDLCKVSVNLPEGINQVRYGINAKRIWKYDIGAAVNVKLLSGGPVVTKWLGEVPSDSLYLINEAVPVRYRSSWKSEPEESSTIPAQALERPWAYNAGSIHDESLATGKFYKDHYGVIPHEYWNQYEFTRENRQFFTGGTRSFGDTAQSAGVSTWNTDSLKAVLNGAQTYWTVSNKSGFFSSTNNNSCVAKTMYESGEWKKADGVRYYSLQARGVRIDKNSVQLRSDDARGGLVHIGGEGSGLTHIVDKDGNTVPVDPRVGNGGVQLIDNWRGTGRQMLIVTVVYDEQIPHSTDCGTRNNVATATNYEVKSAITWTSYYSVEDYTIYGSNIGRLEAAETFVEGDTLYAHSAETIPTQLANITRDKITDKSTIIGQPDSVPEIKTGNTKLWSDTEREYLTDLNSDHNNPVFVYAKVTGSVSANPALLADFTKTVRNSTDVFFDRITWVNPEEEYTYRFSYRNPERDWNEKSIVIYDSLETFDPIGRENDKRFQGTMTGINVDAFTAQGIAPKVYVSTEGRDVAMNTDVSDTGVWTRVDDDKIATYDYSGVKAFAIDCSEKTDGSEFWLEPFGLLVAEVTMKAPTREEAIGLLSVQEPVRYAFNDTVTKAVIVKDNGDGTVTNEDVSTPYTFTTVGLHRDTLDIKALKVLEGRNLEAGKFHFELVDSTGKVWGTATNRADGTVLFDPIKITAVQAGELTFTLREVEGVADAVSGEQTKCPAGYTCDPVEYKLKVKIVELVDPRTGQLSGKVSVFPEYITEFVGDVPTFTNRYAAEGDGEVHALKTVRSATVGGSVPTLAADDFEFVLTPVGGAPGISGGSLRVGNKADGSIDFTGLHYTQADLDVSTGEATYTYELREETTAGLCTDSKWQCDGHVETVTMTLRDNGNGTISATASYDTDGARFVNEYDDQEPLGIRLANPRFLLIFAIWGLVFYGTARYIRRLRT